MQDHQLFLKITERKIKNMEIMVNAHDLNIMHGGRK